MIIKDQESLEAICQEYGQAPYIAVDTEFVRTSSYWPHLCLIQIAYDAPMGKSAVIIDPIANDLDLKPFFKLMEDESILKIFHAARQDVEALLHKEGIIPSPIFDTQIAASICGFGEQVSYSKLVFEYLKIVLDKSHQYMDWSNRPLSASQIKYALGDVVHLCGAYENLREEMAQCGRTDWMNKEMQALSDRREYDIDHANLWKRFKKRNGSPVFLSMCYELLKWREEKSRHFDIPRAHLLKDTDITGIASIKVLSFAQLHKFSVSLTKIRELDLLEDLFHCASTACENPKDLEFLKPREDVVLSSKYIQSLELLKVLLGVRAQTLRVAPSVIACISELESYVWDSSQPQRFLSGWRYEHFGKFVQDLKDGNLALTIEDDGVSIVPFVS